MNSKSLYTQYQSVCVQPKNFPQRYEYQGRGLHSMWSPHTYQWMGIDSSLSYNELAIVLSTLLYRTGTSSSFVCVLRVMSAAGLKAYGAAQTCTKAKGEAYAFARGYTINNILVVPTKHAEGK